MVVTDDRVKNILKGDAGRCGVGLNKDGLSYVRFELKGVHRGGGQAGDIRKTCCEGGFLLPVLDHGGVAGRKKTVICKCTPGLRQEGA